MPDNRLTLTIEAQNQAQAAFKQLQADVRQSNEALQKTGQAGRQGSGGIKVMRDELGRFHDVATGRFVSARRVVAEGMQTIERGMRGSSGAVRQLGRDFRFLQNNIQVTSGVVQQFTRSLTAQTQAIIEQATRVERLKLGLETLSPSIQEAEEQYRRLIDVARLPGIDFSNALQANLQLQAIGESGEEATRILKAFGNALALGGASTADIQRVIYGLRQLIADGVVLQRELNLITARVPVSIPILREQFGGVRAEDIREHFESIGVSRSDQAREFIKILTEDLEKLPSASETAANAIENLGDTVRRTQASVGEGLLPVVKETIATLESLLLSVEKDEGLKTAISDWLAFATAMGTVTAGVVGVAAVIPLLGGLLNPIGLTALAAGALAGAFVKAEVAAARFREEYRRTQATVAVGLRVGRGENTEAIEKEIARLEARRTFLQNRIASLREEVEAERSPIAALATTHLTDESLRVSTERQTDAILEQNDAYKTYQSQLFQVDKAIEVLTRRTDKLSESQQDAADTAENSLARAFKSLTDAATGTDAQIAEALQRFENVTAGADPQITDLARDIGSQLVSIAESTTVAQIESSKKRVDALARDNSLIIADSEQLQALLLAGEEAFYARRRQLREQENAAYRDQFTLEVHDEEAQALTNALLQFQDLQKDVQEAVGLDAKRSAEGQATAYIEAYRDSIDPAILHLIETVKTLRGEVRGSIQDLERLQAQDAFRLEVHGEVGAEQGDALTELFDLQQAVQGDLTRNQIENLNKRAEALKATLANETLSLQSYAADATAIQEQLRDKSLELLGDVVDARQAAFEDEARTQRQAEERKREENAKTYDFHAYLNELRRKSVAEATQDLARLEERALNASSQRSRETLIRDTAQFVDAYQERGEAFQQLVDDATQLGQELQQAFDLSEQTRRLEDFRDGLAGVFDDLIGISLDHFWDSLTDGADSATEAFGIFTDRVRGDFELLENDVTRLDRQVEDFTIRLSRIGEDEERRIRQLERQRRSLLARASTGNQRDAERTRQRAQDISFRIASLREDFDVRRQRAQEDADRRRNRAIDDALQRRERLESRQSDEGLLSKLGDSLASSVSSAVSSAIATSLADYLTKKAFDTGVSLITTALGALGIGSLTDTLKGLFGGGDGDQGSGTGTGDGTGDGAGTGEADVDGTIKTLTVDPDLEKPAVDVAGLIKSAMQATDGYTIPSIDAKGRITSAEVSGGARIPSVPGLKGGVSSVVLQNNAQLPLVPGLTGTISSVSFADDFDSPNLPGFDALINSVKFASDVEAPALPGLTAIVDSLRLEGTLPPLPGLTATIEEAVLSGDIDPPAIEGLHGIIDSVGTNFDAPRVNVEGLVTSLTLQADAPKLEGLTVAIEDVVLSDDIDLPNLPSIEAVIGAVKLAEDVDLPTVRLDATAVVGPVTGGQVGDDRALRDTDEDLENPRLDLTGIEQPVELSGVIKATLMKLFDEPIILQGRIVTTGGGGGGGSTPQQSDGGGETESRDTGAEDAENYSAVPELSQSINNLDNTLKQVTTNGNLNPALGPVDLDIPDALDRLNRQTDFTQGAPINAGQPGFGDLLGAHSQFRPGGGGAGAAQPQSALRVAFPREALIGLVNIHTELTTHTKNWIGANQHLATMRTFIANEMFPAINTRLTNIADTLNRIQFATEKTADAPLVDRLVDAGVSFPTNPQDPTNQALVNSPLLDILTQPGLSLFAGFDNIQRNLEFLQHGMENTQPVNLAEMPGISEGNPLYAHIVNQQKTPDVQKVQLVGGKLDEVGKINNTVSVKHVGSLAVTQGGEFVVQLAGGGTIPVHVEGGRLTVDLAGGLESLALDLADQEVSLRAVGAL